MTFAGDGTLYISTDRNPQGQQGPMTGTIWKIDIVAKTATPLVENIGRPRGLAVLPDGRIVATDYQHHVVELIDPVTHAVQVLAGTVDQFGRTDGVGAEARFSNPYSVVVVNGEIVVADRSNHLLRKVTLAGTVSTLAGTGVAGFADGALATAAFNRPQGLAATASGVIYVTDLENFRVRRISGGTVDTIAGNGTGGFADGDDRLAAQFYGLEGLATVADGSKLYVADGGRGDELPYNRVRMIEMQ
jgi:DNA-binding beta-propeller fold protein YncE